MKTPREILLKRHGEMEHRLDEVRQAALNTVTKEPESSGLSLREWLRSFRWHAVGLGAAWLVILCLHVDSHRAQGVMAAIPAAKIPPPRVIMATLRENRRQLSEMIGAETPAAKPQDLLPARPRSERREETLLA
jgi:hypothetical protein